MLYLTVSFHLSRGWRQWNVGMWTLVFKGHVAFFQLATHWPRNVALNETLIFSQLATERLLTWEHIASVPSGVGPSACYPPGPNPLHFRRTGSNPLHFRRTVIPRRRNILFTAHTVYEGYSKSLLTVYRTCSPSIVAINLHHSFLIKRLREREEKTDALFSSALEGQ
jgi:hypothetical protein